MFRLFVLSVICTGCVLGACPAGWMLYDNSCYKFQTDHESWVSARAMCRFQNSDLIAIETKAEQDWFASIARTYNHTFDDEGFWIGGSDWAEEGHWVWEANDNEAFSYTIWAAGQPNNRENREQCLAALHVFDYAWSDEYCDNLTIQYVCEKNLIIRCPGSPTAGGNREQCLAALHVFDYAWSDEYCDNLTIQYVCEKKPTKNAVVG